MAINATVNVNAPIPASPSGTVYIKGDPGPPGPQGPTGPAGQDGQDGYSPTITSVPIIDGHRLTIIDAEGVKTVDVMDGEPGQDGQAGTSAGFGTPSATVDSGTGTPGVSVTASGPDTAKVFSFAFSNLKGATGQDGPAGQDGPMGPPGLEVSNSTPVSNVLAWIDPDEDTEILVPEMHTTGTPNVLDMGSEYLDAAAVYDRTQGKTQAEINAQYLDSGYLLNESYGAMVYAFNKISHLCIVSWNGNETAPPQNVVGTLPEGMRALVRTTGTVLNGVYIEANYAQVAVNTNTNTWTAGFVAFFAG